MPTVTATYEVCTEELARLLTMIYFRVERSLLVSARRSHHGSRITGKGQYSYTDRLSCRVK